jgi:hypothetical protein
MGMFKVPTTQWHLSGGDFIVCQIRMMVMLETFKNRRVVAMVTWSAVTD